VLRARIDNTAVLLMTPAEIPGSEPMLLRTSSATGALSTICTSVVAFNCASLAELVDPPNSEPVGSAWTSTRASDS